MNSNYVVLLGNATKDAEVRYTKKGTPVTTFGLATNKLGADGQQVTQFHSIVAWNHAEAVGAVKKGQSLIVVGSLQTSSWEDQGIKRYKTEVIAYRVGAVMLNTTSKEASNYDTFTDEIPF